MSDAPPTEPKPFIPFPTLHKTYGVYFNRSWKRNAVHPNDLAGHIEYNKFWRFGRALIVDGVVVHTGYFKQEEIEEWVRETLPEIDKNWVPTKASIPYR